MGTESLRSTIFPNARLLVAIDPDGKVRMVRHRNMQTWDLGIPELTMPSALSARKMDNVREGLDAYLPTNDLKDIERAQCKKLAHVILHQKRIDR